MSEDPNMTPINAGFEQAAEMKVAELAVWEPAAAPAESEAALPATTKYEVLAYLTNYVNARKRVAKLDEELEAARTALYEAEQKVGDAADRLPDFRRGRSYSVTVDWTPYVFAVSVVSAQIFDKREYSIRLVDPIPELPG